MASSNDGFEVISEKRIHEILEGYDPQKIKIATLCSHSALQIFEGAADEGFDSIGIYFSEKQKRYYEGHGHAIRRTKLVQISDYKEIVSKSFQEELINDNAIIVPHGSLVEYVGLENFAKNSEVPTHGNRRSMLVESNRTKQREWLAESGMLIPREVAPEDIDRPVLVKYYGAKGGRGAFIARSKEEYERHVDRNQRHSIQEYIIGNRYYFHFFWTPLDTFKSLSVAGGQMAEVCVDRRDEAGIDEAYKVADRTEWEELGIDDLFVVTGNIPVVVRQSIGPDVWDMTAKAVEKSVEMFGGMKGPFCVETVITPKLKPICFEVSQRIAAGSNAWPSGGPSAKYIFGEEMSMGKLIARDIRRGIETNRLKEIVS